MYEFLLAGRLSDQMRRLLAAAAAAELEVKRKIMAWKSLGTDR